MPLDFKYKDNMLIHHLLEVPTKNFNFCLWPPPFLDMVYLSIRIVQFYAEKVLVEVSKVVLVLVPELHKDLRNTAIILKFYTPFSPDEIG